MVNGVAQTGGQEVDLTPANVANTVFDVGTAGGTVILYAQLDVTGTLSGWQQLFVTAPVGYRTGDGSPGQQVNHRGDPRGR